MVAWAAIIAAANLAANVANQYEQQRATKRQRGKIDDIIANIQKPDFDWSSITPEDYEMIKEFTPDLAPFVAEANPVLVRGESEGARAGRQAQMAALTKYRNLGESGDDTQSRIMREEALRSAQVQNQGQQQAIEDQFARRGQMGSTNELVTRLLAQQQAAQGAQTASQQAANDSYNRRLEALRMGSDLGGQIRSDDISLERGNANTINDYNQRFAANKNEYLQNQSNTRNRAQEFNIRQAQDIANRNVEGRNQAQVSNLENYNNLQRQRYGADMDIADMQIGSRLNKIGDISNAAKDRAGTIKSSTDMTSAMTAKK
jgi:hypothetical protein